MHHPHKSLKMNDFRADLHCHTNCSDGTATPLELIQLACKIGLNGLSITDHDTIEAYREALPAANEKNLPLVPGLELSAFHKLTSVHILAYSFSLDSLPIQNFCTEQRERREKRNRAILDLLAAHGMPLSADDFPEEIFSSQTRHSFGRPHIALAMIRKGYVNSLQQAFQEFIGEGKPCYTPGNRFTVEETIEIIHQARGLAVIAHPHLIENVAIVKDMLSMNFDGIEGYYARFPRTAQERWVKIGARKGWLVTGGSDFHGEIKPNIPLGCSWIGEEIFRTLQQHYQSNVIA